MNRFIEQPLAPALGRLPVARIFFDVWNHPGIEDHFGPAGAFEQLSKDYDNCSNAPAGPITNQRDFSSSV